MLANNENGFNLLLDVIKKVRSVTKKELSISIHPRYLTNLSEKDRMTLQKLNLKEIVVMLYSNNAQTVITTMKNIIDKTNGLNIALAQSVEQNINQGEAYSSLDHTDFINAVQKIEQELNHIGLKAIYIQSWEDYKRGD